MDALSHVPPGFRFHPTDEELVDYYLRRKVDSRRFDLDVIKEVDLYRIEPWDLIELCKIGTEEQSDWYFFSHKDKKYPTGTRTNRATTAGFWKATGRDKAIYSKRDLIGMRKTLVFYKGRAPNGQKSDWIMHEYRLETDENGAPQEEGWVVCRVFKKKIAATVRKFGEHGSPCWYDDQVSFMPDLESPKHYSYLAYQTPYNPCKKELDHLIMPYQTSHDQNFLPLLESPKLLEPVIVAATGSSSINQLRSDGQDQQSREQNYRVRFYGNNRDDDHKQAMDGSDQLTDWRVLDKYVASQLSHEDALKEVNSFSNAANTSVAGLWEKQEMVLENAPASNSNAQIELWK